MMGFPRPPPGSAHPTVLTGRQPRKHGIVTLLAAGTVALASISGSPAASAAGVLTLTSSAFQDNGTLAVKNACSDKQRSPNFVGEHLSPPLASADPPQGTKIFSVLLFGPERRRPAGVAPHVVYRQPGD